FVGVGRSRPCVLAYDLDGGGVQDSQSSRTGGVGGSAGVNGLGATLFQGGVVEEGVWTSIEDFMCQRRRLWQVAGDAFDSARFDSLQDRDETVKVHGFLEAIFNRLLDQGV